MPEAAAPPADKPRAVTPIFVGQVMADGTVYAGVSPTTGRRFFAMPADAPVMLDFNDAARYAGELVFGGNNDFRLPSEAEARLLSENKFIGALARTFNTEASLRGTYWLAETEHNEFTAHDITMADGFRCFDYKERRHAVRCVRG